MIVVTGGAGFIGSNLVRSLNGRGRDDIVVVDDLTEAGRYSNLIGTRVRDYVDKSEFLGLLHAGSPRVAGIEAVLHQGACTDTTEPDGNYMMRNNYEYSRSVLDWCERAGVRLIYASSAAVYGTGPDFMEHDGNEAPLNIYGWSKALFDAHVRRRLDTASSQVVGLRYFNVYGPGEGHKRTMASMVTRVADQIRDGGLVRLFGPSHGLQAGGQKRDFIHVDDVVATVLWFLDRPGISGVFNCGTGRARTFSEVAATVIDWHNAGEVEFVEFPEELLGVYQPFTEADLGLLRSVGCAHEFMAIESGIPAYLGAQGVL